MEKASGMILKSYIYSNFVRSRAAPKLIWCSIAKELILDERLGNFFAYRKNCCSTTMFCQRSWRKCKNVVKAEESLVV